MTSSPMETTVRALLADGKGILAADESFPTIEKRLKAIQLPSTEENRRAYRELLFTTQGLNEFISGVILFDETLRQQTHGTVFPEFLAQKGIVPGIKVDLGTASLPNFNGEKITEGLHGLKQRLNEYRELGARFTKWRAVIAIGEEIPSEACIQANATLLALFAAYCQEAGLVPIVEPEVLMNGDHTIERCEAVTLEVLQAVFAKLVEHRVLLEQMLLKCSMVLSGKESAHPAALSDVAEATVRCLRRSAPAAVPGIVFLSGGQAPVPATQRLNAICARPQLPWKLSFSYGRALQQPALEQWKGLPENVPAAQGALRHRARCNAAAVQGRYSEELERSAP